MLSADLRRDVYDMCSTAVVHAASLFKTITNNYLYIIILLLVYVVAVAGFVCLSSIYKHSIVVVLC